MSMALFEAQALHMRFGNRVVLERVDLKVEENMFSGIIGPNGAGKTTCFNVLTGRYRPNRGRIFFAGEDITGLRPQQIARKGLARSFQIMTLFDEYSAQDNVIQALPEMRAMAWRADYPVGRDARLREVRRRDSGKRRARRPCACSREGPFLRRPPRARDCRRARQPSAHPVSR